MAVLPDEENRRKHIREWCLEWSLHTRALRGAQPPPPPRRPSPPAARDRPVRGKTTLALRARSHSLVPSGSALADGVADGGADRVERRAGARAPPPPVAGRCAPLLGQGSALGPTAAALGDADDGEHQRVRQRSVLLGVGLVERSGTLALAASAAAAFGEPFGERGAASSGSLVASGGSSAETSTTSSPFARARLSPRPSAHSLGSSQQQLASVRSAGSGNSLSASSLSSAAQLERGECGDSCVSLDKQGEPDASRSAELARGLRALPSSAGLGELEDMMDEQAVGLGFGAADTLWAQLWERLAACEEEATTLARRGHEAHLLQVPFFFFFFFSKLIV
ncbi:hypothetical protein T492DRAFT_528457 [Pavlovales sp. CCMP2436]|nr:hypothetical protein T492DRAFT_528457 [Pavlovales sp. CCMP2436]